MQQKSNYTDLEINSIQLRPEFDIILNFYKLLILGMIKLKSLEYLDWFFFQTSNLTFVASEIKILFLQCYDNWQNDG